MVRTAAERSEAAVAACGKAARRTRAQMSWPKAGAARRHSRRHGALTDRRRAHQVHERRCLAKRNPQVQPAAGRNAVAWRWPHWRRNGARSEEHTSELQSLMRISYAVFCLKKKNT